MKIITTLFVVLTAPGVGAAPIDLERSYFALTNAPARSAMGIVDHRAFNDNLRAYLAARAELDPAARPDLRLLVPTLVRHAQTGIEMSRVFAILGDPDSGLTVAEFTRITLSGAFEYRGEPIRASRVFQLMTGHLELSPGEVTKHQMRILGELGRYVVDYADLVALALAPGREPFVRNQTSQSVISSNIDRLLAWPMSAHDWATVLSFYEPTVIDDRECAAIASRFETVRDARIALAQVPSDVVRSRLQEAAVRQLGSFTRAVVEEVLAPLGPNPSPSYRGILDRARQDYLRYVREDGVAARPCELTLANASVSSAASTSLPSSTVGRDARSRATDFRVIDGGRGRHPGR